MILVSCMKWFMSVQWAITGENNSLKKSAKPLKNPLGLGQTRTLTFRDLLEELDEFIEPHHYDIIDEIEGAYKKRTHGRSWVLKSQGESVSESRLV